MNTVTTLGATFSTIGVNVVITPDWLGVVPCAATGNTPVDVYATMPISDASGRRVPLAVKRFTYQVNRTLDRNRFLLPTYSQRRPDKRRLSSLGERTGTRGAAALNTRSAQRTGINDAGFTGFNGSEHLAPFRLGSRTWERCRARSRRYSWCRCRRYWRPCRCW